MYKCFKQSWAHISTDNPSPTILKNFSLKGYLKYLCIILNSFSAANGAGRCLSLVYIMYTTFLLNFHMLKAVYHEGHCTKEKSKG